MRAFAVVVIVLAGCGDDNSVRPDGAKPPPVDAAPDSPDARPPLGLDVRPANPTCKAFTPRTVIGDWITATTVCP